MYLIVLHSLYSEVTFNRSIYMLCCFYFVCCILKDMVKRRPFFITLLTLHVVFCWICSIDESPCACITFFFLHFEYRILRDMFNSWISIYYFIYLLCCISQDWACSIGKYLCITVFIYFVVCNSILPDIFNRSISINQTLLTIAMSVVFKKNIVKKKYIYDRQSLHYLDVFHTG